VAECAVRANAPGPDRHDLVLGAGEAAEFDTRLPHWFGSTGNGAVEILSLFGRQGERMHVRANPAPARPGTAEPQRPRNGRWPLQASIQ
jgi:hypothetical protein